jgi:hypothetical protein
VSTHALPVIGIHGAPRSGTTWLGQLFNSNPNVKYCFQPFFSYAFRGRASETSSTQELIALFRDMFASEDDFVTQRGNARLARSAPEFIKSTPTHLVYKEVRFHHLLPHLLDVLPEFKTIGLVRDPRFVLASWFRAPREFDASWSVVREWRNAPHKNAGLKENWYGFERWVELTNLFLQLKREHPKRFMLIRYEDLVFDTCGVMAQLLAFSGIGMHEQTERFIQATTSVDDNDPYGVSRIGVAEVLNSPPHDLDAGIAEEVRHEVMGTPLECFLVSINR